VRIMIWHGWLLEGSGSNVVTARTAEAWRAAGHDVVLLCQERHRDRYPWIDTDGLVDADGPRELTERRQRSSGSGRCVLLRPTIGPMLPVFVVDRYEGFDDVRRFPDLSDEELERYLRANVAALRAAAEWHDSEIVVTGHAIPGAAIARRALGAGRYIAKIHGSDLEYAVRLQDRYRELAREGLGGARAVIGAAREVLERCAGFVPEMRHLGRVIAPGVDVAFRPRARAEALADVADRLARDPDSLRGRPADTDTLVERALATRDAPALGEIAGIGIEVGAFIAGFSLASTSYREAIGSRLVSVRDFLLLFFFIDLGSRLDLGEARDELLSALLLAAFVVVAKPFVIAVVLAAMRYRSRIALEAGITLGQISEFSLILAALGLSVGHVDDEVVTVLTVIALVTIATTSLLFSGTETVARRLAPVFARFEREGAVHGADERASPPEVVVFGLGRFGHRVVRGLAERGVDVLAVDFDPVAISRWRDEGVRAVYGDAEEPELAALLPLPETGWVVSTIRHTDTNLALLHVLRHHGYAGRIAVAAHYDTDAGRLGEAGADRVLLPYASAAAEVVELVTPR